MMLRQTNLWSDLVWHQCPMLLFSSVPDLLYRPQQLPRMFSVLNMDSHCLYVHVQLAHTTSNLLATFQLWSMGQCSQPINAGPPEQHGKAPPYGFPNQKSSPMVMQNPHSSPILIPVLYCFYTAPWEIICNAQFSKTIKCLCSSTADILWGYQALSFSVSSEGQWYASNKACCAKDITIPSVEITFLRWLIHVRVDEIRMAVSRQAENTETLRWICRALGKFWSQELNPISTG